MDFNLNQTLLIKPEVTFREISETLIRLGWSREREPFASPLVNDEPEFVSWSWQGRKPILIYSFNPVVKLRVLDVATLPPHMRGDIAAQIPLLTDKNVDDLLFEPDPKHRLLGLWAAQETERLDLIPQTHRLNHDPDPVVSEQSKRVEERFQKILEAREALMINLDLLCQAASDTINQLDNPLRTSHLKPTHDELKKNIRSFSCRCFGEGD